MRISGITSCVGRLYHRYFAETLPAWCDSLDDVTVVVDGNNYGVKSLDLDLATDDLLRRAERLRVVPTDVFTRYGASFNKGAAINVAYAAANPTDWVVHFDCDIWPHRNWREIVECEVEKGNLYGSVRYTLSGRIDIRPRVPFQPLGYFQLWHSSDPVTWRRPLFQPWHAHAASYDVEFSELWPKDRWCELPIRLKHLGKPNQNWFGPDDTDGELMRGFLATNIKEYREQARNGHGRLPIPEPSMKVVVPTDNPALVSEALAIARSTGPFGIWVMASHFQPGEDWRPLTSLEELERVR